MRRLAVVLALLVAPMVVGCKSKQIVIDPAPYAGLPVSFDRTEKTHVAVFIAPTGGWGAEFDQVRERFEVMQAFITLRRPAESAVVTQAQVKHEVDTNVRLHGNVEVYVREVTGRAKAEGAYRKAGEQGKVE